MSYASRWEGTVKSLALLPDPWQKSPWLVSDLAASYSANNEGQAIVASAVQP